eukprot:12611207-Ditylum_brightwellii.AAC.1
MVKENILTSWYVIDIHKTMYTEEKGIWTLEKTNDNLQQSIIEIDLDLKVLQTMLPDEFLTKNPVFPVPKIIPSYGVLQNYADKIIYNVADNLEQMEKNYNCLPRGAWSHGFPTTSYPTKTTKSMKTKSMSPPQQTNSTDFFKDNTKK